jgi:hypothetical protein
MSNNPINRLQYGQDFYEYGGDAPAGFNSKVLGDTYSQVFAWPHARFSGGMNSGWNLAEKLIAEGKIYYWHNFHFLSGCKGHAFTYGGTWACNTCNCDGFQKPWWIVRVEQDGDAWICRGEGFINLQESDNYAFGATRDEAIKNYGELMLSVGASGQSQENSK